MYYSHLAKINFAFTYAIIQCEGDLTGAQNRFNYFDYLPELLS